MQLVSVRWAELFCARVVGLLWIAAALVLIGAGPLQAQEYRAFWVDAWGAGFLNQSQVNNLLGQVGVAGSNGTIRNANCNMVIVQVRRRADVCYPSAMGEPYMSGLSPSNFNALQAMIAAAHDTTGGKQRVEVHCWMVVFKTRADAPLYLAHDDPGDADNYWITRYDNGSEPSDKPLDPGHPRASEYLTDVCMDLVQNYDVDGIHYDYIRFAANNEGYNPTSVARFNAIYGRTGQPLASDGTFKQWRRDQVTAFVRRVYAHVQKVRPQCKVSGSFVTWNPSPTSSTRSAFQGTRPYYDVFSDWDAWMQEGILDMGVPMTYYNQASLPNDFLRWMNFQKDRKFNRHNIVGPGIYLNSLSNAILQLQMTRDATPSGNYAQGFSGYSYRVPYSGGTWSSFSPQLVTDVTPTATTIPVMTWKSSPTMGHIMGTVTYNDNGQWADAATATITGPTSRTMPTDGTGFFAFIDLPPGTYNIAVSKTGYATMNAGITVTAGNMTEQNFALGATGVPTISNVQVASVTDSAATITWTTSQQTTSQVEYGLTTSYGTLSPLDSTMVTSHSVTLTGLTSNTLYHFRALSTNANGNAASGDMTFTTSGVPQISDVQVTGIASDSATITWTTNAPATSQVKYGTTPSYGLETVTDPALVTSHSVRLVGLSASTLYHFQAVSGNTYGIAQSTDQSFTTTAFNGEITIDNTDPGWANTSPSGNWTVGSSSAVPKIGADYLYTAGTGNTDEASATRKCTWTPNLPKSGLWDVYVFYQRGTNRTTAAPYKVFYNGGTLTSIQEQYYAEPNHGDWYLIGQDLPFLAGGSGYVQLANNAPDTSKYVSADAARFVYKGSGDSSPPTTPVVIDDGQYAYTVNRLHASWTSVDPETGINKCEYRIVEEGGPAVRDWTDVGPVLEVTATGLSLDIGKTYVFEVRATNTDGLVSEVGTSSGITIFGFDADSNNHVDSTDANLFLSCFSGPASPYPTGGGVDCERFDSDGDGDVDSRDHGLFQRCLTGLDAPIDLTCAGG